MPARLEGTFAPTLVPLDQRGEIHERELRRFISWLIEHGIHGLYPNGSTGEFPRFTAEPLAGRRRSPARLCGATRSRAYPTHSSIHSAGYNAGSAALGRYLGSPLPNKM